MKDIEKSKSIRAGLQKGFRGGTSKVAPRRCCGYDTGPDGELAINPDEAIISDQVFRAIQQEKLRRANCPETSLSMQIPF